MSSFENEHMDITAIYHIDSKTDGLLRCVKPFLRCMNVLKIRLTNQSPVVMVAV